MRRLQRYAARARVDDDRRLARELNEQTRSTSGSPRRRSCSRTCRPTSRSRRRIALLAATVAANTLSNVIQRQNQLDQFIGDDQSLLQQIRYVELTQIITHAKATKVTAGGKSAGLGVAIVLGAIVGIALALLSYVVVPTRRRET